MPDFGDGKQASRDKFANVARYISANLFWKVPQQKKRLLSDSPHAGKIKMWSIYVYDFNIDEESCLVVEDDSERNSKLVKANRDAVPRMLKHLGVDPDVVFILTRSQTHNRASAWPATDDDRRSGITFDYDGRPMVHRHFHLIPGMAAVHVTVKSMTPAHEFGHAFSSYTNGFITDLYDDRHSQAFNKKYRNSANDPIPPEFAKYNKQPFASDLNRDSIAYEAGWKSYHPGLTDTHVPALMDNYFMTRLEHGGEMSSVHDVLTKRYILDRINAKVTRPAC
jgi:hypothetical protein